MINKERLEEINDKWDYAYESGKDASQFTVEDIEFLIEQAERVQKD